MVRKALGRRLDKRAVSAAISAVILTSATIALGLVVLAWSHSMSSIYVQRHGETIDAEIARLKERLAVEYIHYDGAREVRVYLLNCGTIGDIEVERVSLKGWAFPNPGLTFLSGNEDQDLDVEEEACVALTLPSALSPGVYYRIRIETARGSTFDSGFTA